MILWFYVVGIFLHAYNPTLDEKSLIVNIQGKIDELAVQDLTSIEPLYDRVVAVRKSKEMSSDYPERKMYILQQLEIYIYDSYLQLNEQKIDLESDYSILKYVDQDIAFTNKYYIPADLTMLFPTETLILSTSDDLSYMMIRETVLPWLQELAFAFEKKFWTPMKINSAWRSFEFQRDWFTQECRDSWLCAKPGHSEHQSWLCVDISWMFWDQYMWMKEQAHLYWFHQSYQKWAEIDWYPEEKRHWRYLWVELATELYESWLTFTEWFKINKDLID